MNVHATVKQGDGGANFHEIADVMTQSGDVMYHTTARNHLVKAMKRFAEAIVCAWNIDYTDEDIERIARDPLFQATIADVLHKIEIDLP